MTHARSKSLPLAYLLWFFAGAAGAHRYYLGRYGGGLMQSAMLVSTAIAVMFWPMVAAGIAAVLGLWVLFDAVLIPFMD